MAWSSSVDPMEGAGAESDEEAHEFGQRAPDTRGNGEERGQLFEGLH